MSTETTEYALVGKPVAVTVIGSKDTYYGTLAAADNAFVTLSDVRWGWHGSAGWWPHGKSELKMFPTSNVRSIGLEGGPE